MNVNLVYDLIQYDWVLSPIHQELTKRGHRVVSTRTHPTTDPDIQVYLAVQDVAYRVPRTTKAPRLFLNHGVSASKSWGLDFDHDVFLAQSDYWFDEAARMGKTSVRIQGWPKTNLLAALSVDRQAHRKEVYDTLVFDESEPLLVYFPTYKKVRPSDEAWVRNYQPMCVYKRLCAISPNVLVFPHQMDDTDEFRHIPWGRKLTVYDDFRLKAFVSADLLVSDTSGCAYEACAIDLPTILMGDNHTLAFRDIPVDIGPHAHAHDLVETAIHMLKNPTWYQDRRAYWSDLILGPNEGQSASSIVDFMETLA